MVKSDHNLSIQKLFFKRKDFYNHHYYLVLVAAGFSQLVQLPILVTDLAQVLLHLDAWLLSLA